MTNFRRLTLLVALAGSVGSGGCGQGAGSGAHGGTSGSGSGSSGASSGGGGSGASGGSGTGAPPASADGGGIMPGTVTASTTPFDPKTAFDATRKVKNLLVGLAPTDAEVAIVASTGAAGLQQLIISWTTAAATQPLFQGKMMFFFRNTFQQVGFTPTVDFQPQLLENGGFDFGPFGVSAVGDDPFARLVQNLQDSFALTAWQLVQDGHPLLETLTTQRYMMTTGLKSLYLQIEMPNDQPYSFTRGTKLPWKIDYSGNPIALTDSLDPTNANYMVFDDEPPVNKGSFFGGGSSFPTCRGDTTPGGDGGAPITVGTFTGYAQLFQRLLGFTPRFPFVANPTCWEHPSKPYFTDQDMSDWQWVTVRALNSGEAYVKPYDLPTLRQATEIAVALPRVGFYTTPAFLALWNTNDSNQHRVTANQTLLAALGASYTSANVIVPISEQGLDSAHAVTGSSCFVCHSGLDPLRQFWANQFDFNDRNDFITTSFTGAAPNPRPTATGGTLAFDSVNTSGPNMLALGGLLGQATDGDPNNPLNQFAAAITQKLCYYANSSGCSVNDPEFRRVAFVFQNSNYNFPALIKEFFSSILVTGTPIPGGDGGAPPALADGGVPPGTVAISIARRDHFCAALSNRLGVPDLCALAAALPTTAQTTTSTIAGSVSADTFSRGSEVPVTPADPNLFFRAAVEELCENLAPLVVDATTGTVYTSANVATAIPDIVQKVMGYPPSDPHYAQAVSILQSHQQSVLAAKQSSATIALRSTFVLACESPTSVSIGL